MKTADLIAAIAAGAAVVALIVSLYVAYMQRRLDQRLATEERDFQGRQAHVDSVRVGATAAQLVSYRAGELLSLVSTAGVPSQATQHRADQRFEVFVDAADRFLDAWAVLDGDLLSPVADECRGPAKQLMNSVETLGLVWVDVMSRGTSGDHASLRSATEAAIMSAQGCATSLHAHAAALASGYTTR